MARSIALVIGPTPPGTGVIAPATSSTASKSTSPTRPVSVRLTPTSMTVAPGLTWAGPISPGTPTAATRMSASLVTSARSEVRECAIDTVASAPRSASISARGLPTRKDRPHDDGPSPRGGDLVMVEQPHHPGGGAGPETGPAQHEQPETVGVEPVDVLGRVDLGDDRLTVEAPGQRELDQDAVHLVVGVEIGDHLPQLGLPDVGSVLLMDRADPDFRRVPSLPTDIGM